MTVKTVHRWLGLALSIPVVIVSVTGSLLLWKREYLWLTVPGAQELVVRDNSLVATAIVRIRDSYAPGDVTFIQFYSEDLPIHKVFLNNRRYAWHGQDGQQIQVWSANERLEDWLLDLHHRFLLGNTVGLNMAGMAGLLLMVMVVFGVILWWPRRRFFRLGIAPTSPRHGAWMISHSNLGALVALPIILLALTGVILVYPSESRVVLLGRAQSAPALTTVRHQEQLSTTDWHAILEIVEQRLPGSTLRWVTPAEDALSDTKVGVQQAGSWNKTGRSSIKFSTDGRLEIKNEYEQPAGNQILNFGYPLHIGKLGIWYRILLTCTGIGIASLVLMGLVSWRKRHSTDN